MSSIYEEVEIEDMIFDVTKETFSYPCPCGDKFIISLDELLDGEDIGNCPSCTLKIRVIYDDYSLDKYLQLKEAAQTTEVKSEATEE